MAANEHKNLSNSNLHDPKDFSVASNDTILSKDDTGLLSWVDKNIIKVDNIQIMGTSAFGTTNYYMYNNLSNNKDSQLSDNYGDSTAGTITTIDAMRVSRYIAYDDCNLVRFTGVITNTSPDICYLALWRVTPVDNDSSALTITVLKEVSVTGAGNNNMRTFDIDMTAESNNTLTKGDLIIPVVKNVDSSATMYFNTTLGLSYDN